MGVRINGEQRQMDWCSRDGYRLVMQGLASMVRIAQSDDNKHAIAAAEWLVAYGENVMREKAVLKAQAAVPPLDRARILDELRGLYAQALGKMPLVVEASAEKDDEGK